MSPSDADKQFIQGWERCSLIPYRDAMGKWTIGWGHLMLLTDPLIPMTQPEADALFYVEWQRVACDVDVAVTTALCTQYQYDALVAFAYNVGVPALRSSTLLRQVNANNWAAASLEFQQWDKGHDSTGQLVELTGLRRRREAERMIFVHADYSGRP
jgi:GH24 family phage-related lysozyme (muramidase)